jgi:hypothetical protein
MGCEWHFWAEKPSQTQKKRKSNKKQSCVALYGALSCASGPDLLDLLTKTVNMIQRAWISKDPTRQIYSRHPTTEILTDKKK